MRSDIPSLLQWRPAQPRLPPALEQLFKGKGKGKGKLQLLLDEPPWKKLRTDDKPFKKTEKPQPTNLSKNRADKFQGTLAKEIIDSVSYRVSRHTNSLRPLPLGQLATPSLPVGPRLKMCDGAGNYSSADHSIPANHPMPTKIAHAWLRWAVKGDLDNKIMAHVMRAAPEPPLSPLEVSQAIQILYETIGHPQPSTLEPEAEQPYRLKLLATFGR